MRDEIKYEPLTPVETPEFQKLSPTEIVITRKMTVKEAEEYMRGFKNEQR